MAFSTSMIYRGAYDPDRQYAANDVVFFGCGYYSAKGATLGNKPTDASYWDIQGENMPNIPIDADGKIPTDMALDAIGAEVDDLEDAVDDLDDRVTALEGGGDTEPEPAPGGEGA